MVRRETWGAAPHHETSRRRSSRHDAIRIFYVTFVIANRRVLNAP